MLEHVLGAVHSREEDAGEVFQLQQEGDLQTRQDPRGGGLVGSLLAKGSKIQLTGMTADSVTPVQSPPAPQGTWTPQTP